MIQTAEKACPIFLAAVEAIETSMDKNPGGNAYD